MINLINNRTDSRFQIFYCYALFTKYNIQCLRRLHKIQTRKEIKQYIKRNKTILKIIQNGHQLVKQQTNLRQVCFTASLISHIRQQYKNGFREEFMNTIVEARDLAISLSVGLTEVTT